MGTLSEIQAKIAVLEAEAEKLYATAAVERQKVISEVVQDIQKKITEYGITAKDLGFSSGSPRKSVTRKAVALKTGDGQVFRGPNGETWISGARGRKPRWLAEAKAKTDPAVS